MSMYRIVLSFVATLFSAAVFGQSLSFYADAMVSARQAENRIFAGDKFNEQFADEIAKPSSFDNAYDELIAVSKVYAPDNSFRTLTWQVDRGDGVYQYYGYLQMSDGRTYRIDTQYGDEMLREETPIAWDKWSGALVYDIFNVDGQLYAFTFRQTDEYTKVKSCEPLVLSDGVVTLGAPILASEDGGMRSRLVLKYSSDASATLSYEPSSQRIVYDNLAPVMGRREGQGPTQVPDGTYRAMEYKEGQWKAIENIYEGLTRQGPAAQGTPRRGKSKDLFGRDRKKKG